MRPKSNTLFHFTKSQETLKLILKNGFWPRYCLEDVTWLAFANPHEYIAYPLVCFCDIPLSRISEHVNFYGEFGVGLTREWAEKNGLNPVLYVAGDNNITASFRELITQGDQHTSVDLQNSCRATARYLYAHSKPLAGRMVVNGQPVEKVFYQESEWRYVPKEENIEEFLIKANFDNQDYLNNANKLTKEHCTLKFTPKDVKYIFVKKDSDIPDIINFIQVELDQHPGADQKILMSRVVSLESLSEDL
ncbi:abortive infection system antitoxin AbiGi family protein [Methylobacillus pratensis]